VPLSAHLDVRQAGLRFLGDRGGQFREAGQAAQNGQGVVIAADFVKPAPARQETIHQVERPAHGAASMQRVMRFGTGSAGANYNSLSSPGKTKTRLNRERERRQFGHAGKFRADYGGRALSAP